LPTVTGSRGWDDARLVPDRAPQGLRTPRIPAYLNWRFDRHPTAGYRVFEEGEGTTVLRPNLRHSRREMVVSDLFGEAAGHALRSVARATNAAYLAGWFSPGSPERHQALLAGMIPLPLVRALTLVARPLRSDLPWIVESLDHWDLALSDLELL
jgi:hypothetical protein